MLLLSTECCNEMKLSNALLSVYIQFYYGATISMNYLHCLCMVHTPSFAYW